MRGALLGRDEIRSEIPRNLTDGSDASREPAVKLGLTKDNAAEKLTVTEVAGVAVDDVLHDELAMVVGDRQDEVGVFCGFATQLAQSMNGGGAHDNAEQGNQDHNTAEGAVVGEIVADDVGEKQGCGDETGETDNDAADQDAAVQAATRRLLTQVVAARTVAAALRRLFGYGAGEVLQNSDGGPAQARRNRTFRSSDGVGAFRGAHRLRSGRGSSDGSEIGIHTFHSLS